MLSDEFLKGFRAAVSSYAMNTQRGAYDAKPSFTPRRRASDQLNEQELTNKTDDNRPLPDELMELLRVQLEPDTYQMLCDALNGGVNDQDPDEEEDKPAAGPSPELIDRIYELVGPHLSDDDNEEFKQLLDDLSSKPAEDEPPPFSGRPTPGGGQDPITSASRARSSARSPAEDARRILSLTPGELVYDMGRPWSALLEVVAEHAYRRAVDGEAYAAGRGQRDFGPRQTVRHQESAIVARFGG